jgi:hypothetical protein
MELSGYAATWRIRIYEPCEANVDMALVNKSLPALLAALSCVRVALELILQNASETLDQRRERCSTRRPWSPEIKLSSDRQAALEAGLLPRSSPLSSVRRARR